MSSSGNSMVIDAVDATNHSIGQVSRADVFNRGVNFRTVHVLIRSKDRRTLLLQELPGDHPRSPTRLGSSVAGYLHAGESYRHAAIRKLREELHIKRAFMLSYVAEIEMRDTGVSKFVQIYNLTYDYAGEFDRKHIKSVRYYPFAVLDGMVEAEPNKFTETFLYVYRAYRENPKWRPE